MTVSDVAAADEYRDLPSGRDPDSHLAARRSAARAFRPRRTLTAIVVAVLVAVVAGLIAASLISKYLGHPVHVIPAAVARDGRIYHWGDPRALVASGVICALGLLLISIAALPGRSRVVPVASEDSLSVPGSTRSVLVTGRPSSPGSGSPSCRELTIPPLACPHMAAKPRTPRIARGSCVTIRWPACLNCVKARAEGTLPRCPVAVWSPTLDDARLGGRSGSTGPAGRRARR